VQSPSRELWDRYRAYLDRGAGAGRLLRTAWEGSLDGREVTITWDGKDDSGRESPAGVYLVRVESGAGEAVGRVVKTQ
jgi:flagellar hook assembly protein FlgD